MRVAALTLAISVAAAMPGAAQSSSATLTGTVVDKTGGVLPGVDVLLIHAGTAQQRQAVTGADGGFIFTTVPPGRYVLKATRTGFTPVEMRDITLNVDDRVSLKVELGVSTVDEQVTVVAESARVSMSPAVSTVVDRQFVENLPLNGRSLQSLLELTPGVVLNRVSDTANEGGQFSVNGQRSNANSFIVDGVSANVGISGGSGSFPGQSGSGQLPGMTALGGTNGLVSVDALQEFRIQTSTYAPEYGRTPGGQISMITRSGTNDFNGSVFEYFRDDALDANDWFSKNRGLKKPELSQHNFGGVIGGPIVRNRTFFFFSYEALRLDQPLSTVVAVPSMALRATATPEIRQILNTLPIPNGRDLAGGFAEFSASYSDRSELDSTSIRVDHNSGGKFTFFGRYSYAPSVTRRRAGSLSYTAATNTKLGTLTGGATWVISGRLVHDLRVNYSKNEAPFEIVPDTFGGAVVPPESIFLYGRNPSTGIFLFSVTGGGSWQWGTGTDFTQRQFNLVDSLTWTTTAHEWKFGLDYRRVFPILSGGNNGFQQYNFTPANMPLGLTGFYAAFARETSYRSAAWDNLSLYAQDNWRLNPRFTMTYGVRWEYVPPPHSIAGPNAITLEGLDDPLNSPISVAPRGTPLWNTKYDNFAPRVGASYQMSNRPGRETVVRGGYGLFHDLGLGQSATSYRTYPFAASKTVTAAPYPLDAASAALPRLVEDPPQQIWLLDRNIELPYTHQWNASLERSLGTRQTLTVTYTGAAGRKLLKLDRYAPFMVEWPTVATPINVGRNRGYSDYRALQFQYQRRLHRGLQALASYTWGRSLDTTSSDIATNIPAERLPPEADYGYSDFDVRHVFTGAFTYNVPQFSSGVKGMLASGWGFDLMLRARSAFPINITTTVPFPPTTQTARPNVTGQPYWIADSTVPGGERLNLAAFAIPPANTQGDLKRGDVRGYGVSQTDLAVRRDFPLPSGMRLQFRFEMFNLWNQVTFADPSGSMASATFGVPTTTLGRGFGGLNGLYQIGGPRSCQIALKLFF